jgi:hypothetical protein
MTRTVDSYRRISVNHLQFKLHADPFQQVNLRIYPINHQLYEIRFWCEGKLIDIHKVKASDLEGVRAPRGCTGDEGRPLGPGLQERASNRLKLHGLRALVVSVEGKGTAKTVSGEVQGDERKRTTDEVSKTKR